MGVKGEQSISYIYSRRAYLFTHRDPSIGRVGSMVERVLTVREVRGSISTGFNPHLGRFHADHFRNVQHHKDLHLLQRS